MEFMFENMANMNFLEALGAFTLLFIVTYLIIIIVTWIIKINDSFNEIEKMNNKIKRLEKGKRKWNYSK